jgi:hypothetical protein
MYLDRSRSSWPPHPSAFATHADQRTSVSRLLRRLKLAFRRLRNSDALVAALAAAMFALALLVSPQGVRAEQHTVLGINNKSGGEQDQGAATGIERGHRHAVDANAIHGPMRRDRAVSASQTSV